MAHEKNPGEGVPKETPARHSLGTLESALAPALGASRAKALITTLRDEGYFDLSLLQQVNAAVRAVVGVSTTATEKKAVLGALEGSESDRMRGYAAAVAYAFLHDSPERCLRDLYRIQAARHVGAGIRTNVCKAPHAGAWRCRHPAHVRALDRGRTRGGAAAAR
jgi:hypothetical protein